MIILFIAFMIVGWAVQSKLKSKFKKYSATPLSNGMSGKEVAEKMLADHGITKVRVISTPGKLTDHYNPKDMTVNLSPDVYEGRNISAAAVAGEKIASTAGLSMSSMIDPQSGGQTLVLSTVLTLFLISCFLSLDGHLYLLKLLIESYVYLPIGLILDFSEVSNVAVNTFGDMLYLAALISLPIVGGLLLIQCSIGIITRSAPSLNLFSFGFPIALISVFIFLYLGVGPISNAFSDLTATAINLIDDVLHSYKEGN